MTYRKTMRDEFKGVHTVETRERPKTAAEIIVESFGDLSGSHVLGDYVLVAVYVRPERTVGGIFLPLENRKEDEHQGKVGVVLKVGDTAFKYRGAFNYEGTKADVGDLVVFRVSDGWSLIVKGQLCRMVDCNDLRMKIPNPEFVF